MVVPVSDKVKSLVLISLFSQLTPQPNFNFLLNERPTLTPRILARLLSMNENLDSILRSSDDLLLMITLKLSKSCALALKKKINTTNKNRICRANFTLSKLDAKTMFIII